MPTVLKKNKVFIDKIDPTNSNLDYLNTRSTKNEKRTRMSFIFGDHSLISDNTVTAKLSNSVSVSALHHPTIEKIRGGPILSKEIVRLPMLGLDRE